MDTSLLQSASTAADIKEDAVIDVVNNYLQTVGVPVTGKTFAGWQMYEHDSQFSADGKFRTWAAPESDTSVSLSDDIAKAIDKPTDLGDAKAWAILTIAPAKPKDGRAPRFPFYVNLRLRWQRPRKVAKSVKEALSLAEGVAGIDKRLNAQLTAMAAEAQKSIGQ